MTDLQDRIHDLLEHGGFRRGPLLGLSNDATYWDMVRTHGPISHQVLRYLACCSRHQTADRNHT